MSGAHKPAALLRLMAERQGQRITARDAVALRLAASTLDELQQAEGKHFAAYRDALHELVSVKTAHDALRQSITAALEMTA